MSIKCILVDDEPMALDKMKNYISRIPYFEVVAACEDAADAMQVISENKVDAMFIDINMPDINGLDFIRTLADPPLVVFVTAYADYAVDSYKVRAVDYLLKPYDFEDFQRASGNIYKQWELLQLDKEGGRDCGTSTDGFLYMKVDYRYIRVSIDDIVYIEGMNEYLKIHQVKGTPFLTHTTFRQIKDSLPDYFLQVHRSYLVNMKHVMEVERSVLLMSDGSHITVSEGNKECFMQYLQKHSIKK